MQFTNEEIETIKRLIDDHGFEYGIKSNSEEVYNLAKKIGMERFCRDYENFHH